MVLSNCMSTSEDSIASQKKTSTHFSWYLISWTFSRRYTSIWRSISDIHTIWYRSQKMMNRRQLSKLNIDHLDIIQISSNTFWSNQYSGSILTIYECHFLGSCHMPSLPVWKIHLHSNTTFQYLTYKPIFHNSHLLYNTPLQ